jgi:peptide/nickel transport system substrate-binding protein
VSSLDPQQGLGFVTNLIASCCFDSLVGWKTPECTEIAPALAESWTASEDAKTFEFTLRDDVYFHEGTHLTADIVKDSIQRTIDLETPMSFFYADIDTIEVLDTYSLRITLKNPDWTFLGTLAMRLLGAVVPREIAETAGEAWGISIIVGTGPFKFVEWIKGERCVLVRNDEYWGGKPTLEKIIIKLIADPTTARIALEAGEIDMFARRPHATDIPILIADPDIEWTSVPTGPHRHLSFSQRVPPMNNTLVRQAISYAIDLSKVNTVGFKGTGTLSYSYMPSIHTPFYKPTFEKYKHNDTRALELLAQAGYPDGFSIDLYYTPHWDPADADVALIIQEELAEVGIDVTVHMAEWGAFLELLYPADGGACTVPMAIDYWISDAPTPEHSLMLALNPDYGFDGLTWGWTNDRFSELGYLGKGTTNITEQIAYYHEAQDILAEDAPIYPFVDITNYVFYRNWVKDFVFYPNPYMWYYSFMYTTIEEH